MRSIITIDIWKEEVRKSLRDGYFKPSRASNIVCENLKCEDCKYRNKCPNIGGQIYGGKYLTFVEHIEAMSEFYPEILLSEIKWVRM